MSLSCPSCDSGTINDRHDFLTIPFRLFILLIAIIGFSNGFMQINSEGVMRFYTELDSHKVTNILYSLPIFAIAYFSFRKKRYKCESCQNKF